MTDPTPPLFAQNEKAVIDGIGVVTIKSWPVTNDGFVYWSQVDAKTGAITERTDHLSTIVVSPYEEPTEAEVVEAPVINLPEDDDVVDAEVVEDEPADDDLDAPGDIPAEGDDAE